MLYHKDVFMPRVKLPTGTFKLEKTRHAEERGLKLPTCVNFAKVDIFEIEIENGKLTKVCYRTSYDKWDDIIVVVSIPSGRIRTAWKNSKTDSHRTLDLSRYATR